MNGPFDLEVGGVTILPPADDGPGLLLNDVQLDEGGLSVRVDGDAFEGATTVATAADVAGGFIVGIPGPPGPRGSDAVDGRDGRDGRDGSDGRNGRDGLDGAPGRDGASGRDGRPGEAGPAPWGVPAPWAPGTRYGRAAPASCVTLRGMTLVCVSDHTAVDEFDPTRWVQIGGIPKIAALNATITVSTDPPPASAGNDGDIWLQY